MFMQEMIDFVQRFKGVDMSSVSLEDAKDEAGMYCDWNCAPSFKELENEGFTLKEVKPNANKT